MSRRQLDLGAEGHPGDDLAVLLLDAHRLPVLPRALGHRLGQIGGDDVIGIVQRGARVRVEVLPLPQRGEDEVALDLGDGSSIPSIVSRTSASVLVRSVVEAPAKVFRM